MPDATARPVLGSTCHSRGYIHAGIPASEMRSLSSGQSPKSPEKQKLSINLLNRLLYVTAGLLLLSICMFWAAKLWGDDISRAGHSPDTTPITVLIGNDRLRVPANAIRYSIQRTPGPTDKLDLYFHWPTMSGYSDALKGEFNQGVKNANLVFLTLEKRSMGYDMSGRIGPIYERFFTGEPQKHRSGLTRQALSLEGGFVDEDLFYADTQAGRYATRCIRTNSKIATPFCIRDIHIGTDLMLTYRFHQKFLSQWAELDTAMRMHVKSLISK